MSEYKVYLLPPEPTYEQIDAESVVGASVDATIAFVEGFTGFLLDKVDDAGQLKMSEVREALKKISLPLQQPK